MNTTPPTRPRPEDFPPPPLDGPVVPLEILPQYLALHGYETVEMTRSGVLVVRRIPSGSSLHLAEAAEAASSS